MSDPTASVTLAAFGGAFALFLAGTLVRRLSASRAIRETPLGAVPRPIPDISGDSPPPPPGTLPPPLPDAHFSGVPASFYHRFDLLGIGLLFAVFLMMSLSSIQAAADPDLKVTPGGLAVSIAFQFIVAGIVIAVMTSRVSLKQWLGLRWEKWPWVFLIAPGCVFSMWLVFIALQGFGYMKWIESLGAEPVQETVKLLQTSNDPWVLGLMTFAAVIVAPLCEELVFRGYLYPVAKKYSGPWIGAVFSAVVFAAAHGNLLALLPLTLFGLLLVFIYEKTGSLWSTIAIHFCFNGATVLLQALVRLYHLPIDPP
ncbi:MAG: CPBP family intramembrane metalloprotease [Luteolibacter sp.]